jgi:5-hydroxyisourate hydrolase-like protein (transthyretin family)
MHQRKEMAMGLSTHVLDTMNGTPAAGMQVALYTTQDEQATLVKRFVLNQDGRNPEVMAEIERSVRLAAPYPAPVLLGGVTYTDTWLWHKSGRFQLDTLTEGQL